jgi:ribosome-associated protein
VFFHTRLDDRSATEIRSGWKEKPQVIPKEQIPELSTRTALKPLSPPFGTRRARPEVLDLALQTLEEGKAEDIITIDLAGKTTIADHMVIASGRSARQVTALTEHLEEVLSRRVRISIEGKAQADWVLIDAGDVIVHLFRPEIRSYYNLEKMWGGALLDSEAVRL